jgi:signal transduction histidine kinase/DNA-binding response OmpR family regulator
MKPAATHRAAPGFRLDPGWRRLRFVLLLGIPGVVVNALAVDLPGSVPFLIGNMAFVTLALRLDWRYALLGALLVTAGFVDPRWTLLALAEALLVSFTRAGQGPLLHAWARVWLPLLLPALWLTWPASGDPLHGLLGVCVLLANGLVALVGARLITRLAVASRQRGRQSFRDQLAAQLTVATATPLAFLLMLALQLRFSDANTESEQLLQPRAGRLAEAVDGYVLAHRNAMQLAAHAAASPRELPLAELGALYPLFDTLQATDATGAVLARWPADASPRWTDAGGVGADGSIEWLQRLRQPDGTHVSPVFARHGAVEGPPLAVISVPVRAADGRLDGALRGALQLQPLHGLLIAARGPVALEFAILDGTGTVVFSSLPGLLPLQPQPPGSALDPAAVAAEQARPPRDIMFQRARAQAPVLGWEAVALRAMEPVRMQQTLLSLVAALFFLGLLSLLTWLGRALAGQMARPLGEFVERLQAVHLLDPATLHPLDLAGANRELQELIEGFDAMLVRLGELHRELTRALDDQGRLNRELEARVEQRTAELRTALAQAERLAQAKTVFLANMSHELRTPLASILGYTEQALQRGTPASVWLDTLRTIERNGRHLLDIVNDVLDASKIEAGQLEVERAPLSPLAVAEQAVALMAPRAASRSLLLRLELDWPLPERVLGDRRRLQQVVLNLLGNAVKFTERGFVLLRVGADAQAGCWWFEVEDSGIGIEESQRARLFERFEQADVSTTRRFGGTGLGLFISRELVRAMGGDIEMHSRPGHGSRIRASLPLPVDTRWLPGQATDATAVDAASEHPAPRLHGRILLAEDVPDLRRLLVSLLRSTGADVVEVDNGRLAFERASSEHFDLLLLDMHMPVMDGREATEALRSSGYRGPIVALTADVIAEDVARYRAAGCDRVLAKPVDRQALFDTLRSYLREVEPGPATSDATAEAGVKRVVVDQHISAALAQIGERFRQQLPGEIEALRSAHAAGEAQRLGELLHRIKGSAGSFGFARISALAGEAESAHRSGDTAAFAGALAALVAEMEAACE